LHVHISRDTLNTPALCRIAIFVHSQRTNLEKLGRREYGSYCKYKVSNDGTGEDLVRDYDRYGAVNFCNTDTVEYRFPRGSLNPATILGTVQLMFAITEFCRDKVSSRELENTATAWDSFTEFVHEHTKFSAASTYLEKRGF